ncbi:MAG: hypothetical protein QF588_01540 [Candidatus Poseidoniaceae archaeon]|nr:hypothetical protein [Candidatus Poseidoniaceae archaeon]
MQSINKIVFLASIFCLLSLPFIGLANAQDQVEIPSWEVGWETNMDGVYELELSGQEDIMDSVEFFVANERMVDLNLEISIEWDESDIPIELEYDESISVAASDNQTFTIEISDVTGYAFERSPTQSMTLLLSAQEVALEQAIATQEIDAELAVPSVFELAIESQSKDEILYAGSSVEYTIMVTNNGNGKDVIKMPESSVKSCPSVTIEGLDAMKDIELLNSSTKEYDIRITASSSQPERMCEITISIKSAGNGQIVSTIFQVEVVSNSANDDDRVIPNDDEPSDDSETQLTETNTLNFLGIYEIILIVFFAMSFRWHKRC